jgi:histidinol dehydrogenase
MRILELTDTVENRLLRAREERDEEAERVALAIIGDVRRRGDAALFAWTRKLDGVRLTGRTARVSTAEIRDARAGANAKFVRAVKHAAKNVRKVAKKQLPREWIVDVEPGVRIGQIVRPIESVGCYVPGGRFALISTLVMTAVPAQVAGVKRIVVTCPKPTRELLAAAAILGVAEIIRVGGAQAIAALAYGTRCVPRVDKIFGPGNRFVTAAKQLVSGDCAIDLPAGPTEAVVLASGGNADWIAADLLAQAEHAPDAGSFFVTTSKKMAREVQAAVDRQLKGLERTNPAHDSIQKKGAILMAKSTQDACTFVNRFAPEHLTLTDDNRAILRKISAAGTVFLGPWAAQPFGDYASGSNHVLPTGGWARTRGGLSVSDFVKCIAVQEISRTGARRLSRDVQLLAAAEGLIAHQRAAEIRR